jgi:arylsulfatase A-like enzyme
MRRLLFLCGILTATVCFADAKDERPNVVVILADDQGWGDLSVHGNTNLATPNIDSLARDGALFEHFYVCPVCSPTRAEFLTGRYHPRGGVFSTSTGGERLDLDEATIAETFQAAGYATGAFGKWHNGTQYPYHPNARGFAEFYGFCSGHWGHYFDPILEHNGQTVRGKGFIADDLTDHALEFIAANRGQPFFCYLPFNTPHSPMQVPDRFYDKFQQADLKLRCDDRHDEDLETTRAALAMCENLDWNVGRVLSKLDELKLVENTIVVYFSDNGPNSWRWNGGMKGRKASTDEGGVRSPLLIRWPDYISGGLRIQPIAGAIDLLPTLADLAEVEIAGDKPLDGRSLAPLLLLTGSAGPPRAIFSHWNGKVSLRTDRFRFDDSGKLFDMLNDPGQFRDVATEHADVTETLGKDLDAWKRDVLSELTTDQRPFTVGYQEFPTTNLPARDAVPHGNIQRSARAPNCSYLRNWTSVDDSITWDVDVHTAGKYRAVLYYTCPPDDLGAEIELSLGDHRAQAKVTHAFDPPLVGAQQDRVPRVGESLVKEFAPLEFSPIDLPAGRGTLTLRARSKLGKQVLDVRGLVLTLSE